MPCLSLVPVATSIVPIVVTIVRCRDKEGLKGKGYHIFRSVPIRFVSFSFVLCGGDGGGRSRWTVR